SDSVSRSNRSVGGDMTRRLV
ncbi:small, acid-soluble spore protein, alpha/beta type, partial [Klebsiella pneumoniae]|nr:small, acid-soluble spore protein, alpha/beta type [Klebsiella pneumoniae]